MDLGVREGAALTASQLSVAANTMAHSCFCGWGCAVTTCPLPSGGIQPTSVDRWVRGLFRGLKLFMFCSFSYTLVNKTDQYMVSHVLQIINRHIALPFWSRLEWAILTNPLNFTEGPWSWLRWRDCFWSYWVISQWVSAHISDSYSNISRSYCDTESCFCFYFYFFLGDIFFPRTTCWITFYFKWVWQHFPEKGTIHQLKQTKLYLFKSNPGITVEQSEVIIVSLKSILSKQQTPLMNLFASVLSTSKTGLWPSTISFIRLIWNALSSAVAALAVDTYWALGADPVRVR